jgi:hypothetical protein
MNNKQRILQMVKDGIIEVEEGLKLLEALGEPIEETTKIKNSQAKMLRVKVDSADGDVVNVNVPLSLVKAGVDLANQIKIDGESIESKGVDINLIMQAIEEGATGEIVNIESADGDSVHIIID